MNSSKKLEAINSIRKKLHGKSLSYQEIFNIMDEISHDRLGDILTTYFVASGILDGFSKKELYYLTKAMVETGTQLKFDGIVADKHSIGGLAGTRATMIIVPIIAAAGYKIPKTSSRAITSPAGTADVMEILCEVNFTPKQIENIIDTVGGCIVWGGHLGIAPADDEIIQVEEPLSMESMDKVIVSIMAKKIAAGSNHLVIDIPVGRTMKMKTRKEAELMKRKFEYICQKFSIDVDVLVSRSKQPAGNGVGPMLEAIDVVKILKQEEDRPVALEKRSLVLAGRLLDLCHKTDRKKIDGLEQATDILTSGQALEKMKQIIEAQKQKRNLDEINESIMKNTHSFQIISTQSGTIKKVHNLNLNSLAKVLGAPQDVFAGMYVHKRIGDNVKRNEQLITLYSSSEYRLKEARETITNFPVLEIK